MAIVLKGKGASSKYPCLRCETRSYWALDMKKHIIAENAR